MAKEKTTDNIIHDLLVAAGIEHEAGESRVKEIKEALKTASKRGTGKAGFPEFVAYPGSDFLIVIEDKAEQSKQAKYIDETAKDALLMDTSSVINYAENGALHYASIIVKETSFKKVFAIGCSGIEEGRMIIRPIFVTPTNYKLLPRIKDFSVFRSENIKNYYLEKVLEKKTVEAAELDDIIDRASNLHEHLRNYGSLGETEKPLIVSAILLALCEDSFSTEQLTGDNIKTDGEKIYDALAAHLTRVKVDPQAKKERVLEIFRPVLHRPVLSEIHPVLERTPLRYFAEYLHSNILMAIQNNAREDVLGRFYGEFLRYSGGDGQSLGVVLTPSHITQLFCDLLQIKSTDKVFDPCTGTAGFPVAAMNCMLSQVNTKEDKKKIKENNLHGIELREDMFAIATTNMILRGDGQSNFWCADFLKQDTKELQSRHFTVGMMNPPYSQAKNDATRHLSELKFICKLLDCLDDGGRCAVIVPQSTMVGKTKQDKTDKRYIYDHHTLEGVITCNTDTFYGVGTNVVIAVFTAHKPHPANKLVKFVNFKDDGYEVAPHIGLLATERAAERKKLLLDCWLEGKSAPTSFIVRTPIEADDEWLHSFYYFNEDIPSEADFEKTMADYLTFEFNMVTHGRGYLFGFEG